MSKKAIDTLLTNLVEHIKENKEYRKESDTKEHYYEVSSVEVAKQLKFQLLVLTQTIPEFDNSIIDRLAKKYASALYTEFNKEVTKTSSRRHVNFKFTDNSTKNNFTVVVSQKGTSKTNVFSAINSIRVGRGESSPLHTLRTDIIAQVFNNNTNDNVLDVVYGSKHIDKETKLPILTKDNKEIRSGGLLQLGHKEKNSIAEKRVVLSLEHLKKSLKSISNVRASSLGPGSQKPNSTLTIKAVVNSFISEKKIKQTKISLTYVRDESSFANSTKGGAEERALINSLAKTLEDKLRSVDWINQEGSRSPKQIILSELIKASLKGDKKAKVKANFSNPKVKTSKEKYTTKPQKSETSKQVTRSKEILGTATNIKGAITKSKSADKKSSSSQNWSSVIAIINTKLADRIKDNMIAPRLVNRTGRFAESAKVTNVETSVQGYPSFVFDYQRNPYEVFDRVNGRSPWNTPNRDPKSLIALSVRQIAQELAIGRFYTRRA